MESIQEKCLDEVLGISKKRLLSIINDTKCPTDTESSDDDIQDIVEHISLDEISSDDESSKRPGTAAKKSTKKKANTEVKVKKEATTEPAGEKKEYSVLELLELQARARAIRSQLALEPVTKIELDEDDDPPPPAPEQKDSPKNPDERSTPKKKRERKSKDNPSKSKASNGKSPTKKRRSPIRSLAPGETSSAARPVKIIRNFRKQSPETHNSNNVEVKKEVLEKNANKSREARDSSPEVMTILASPVTLCISSDDEEGTIEPTAANLPIEESKTTPDPPEEGEIADEPECSPVANESPDGPPEVVPIQDVTHDDPQLNNGKEKEVVESTVEKSPESQRPEEDTSSAGLEQSKDDADILCVQLDDDCIDLECTDQIEDEEQQTQDISPAKEVVEIVDSSADEEAEQDSASNDTKSWGERWLGSSKVSKILATSKLGNQVRRRIKLSKLKEKQESVEDAVASKSAAIEEKTPKEDDSQRAEEGSIDHFKNIFDKSNTKAD